MFPTSGGGFSQPCGEPGREFGRPLICDRVHDGSVCRGNLRPTRYRDEQGRLVESLECLHCGHEVQGEFATRRTP